MTPIVGRIIEKKTEVIWYKSTWSNATWDDIRMPGFDRISRFYYDQK